MQVYFKMIYCFNSLWPNDDIGGMGVGVGCVENGINRANRVWYNKDTVMLLFLSICAK